MPKYFRSSASLKKISKVLSVILAFFLFLFGPGLNSSFQPQAKSSTSHLAVSGPGSAGEEDDEDKDDEDEVKTSTSSTKENDDADEDVDEIKELEFEDEDEDEEDDEEELVEGDTEQKVEIKVKNGKIVIKIKTKNHLGREVEEEIEATGSANIASLKIKIKDGETTIKLKTSEGKLVIVEENEGESASAITQLPITFDSENNVIRIEGPSGSINISQLPKEIIDLLIASEAFDGIEELELKTKTKDGSVKVVYHAKGDNHVMFLGLFSIKAEIEAEVDAQTGDSQIVSQPWFLKFFGFLFS